MSKVNPIQTSASVSSIEQLQQAPKIKPPKKRRKSDRLRLPTPPPDPTTLPTPNNENLPKSAKDKEAEFLEYLETLQKSPLIGMRTGAIFAPAEATEHALNHLDKLYKLMDQMLTLREQNIALHRRIMDLERFRSMQCMDKQQNLIAKINDVPVDDYDTNAENILYGILNDSKKESKKVQMRFQKSFSRKSLRLRRNYDSDVHAGGRRISMPFTTNYDKPQAKVSKWTKVKAAFKWEKASPTVSDAKSQDSGLGLGQPVNYEVARYLRVPSTSEEASGVSPADSGAAEVSTPGTLSSASSAEDLHRQHARRRTHEDTSDDDQLFMYDYIPCGTKDEASTSKGNSCLKHKTPWAKVKDIIQTQTKHSFKIRHRLSAKSDDFKLEDSMTVESDNEEVFDSEEPKSPILIIQSPEEISMENEALSLEHSIPVDVIARYRIINEELGGTLESKWEKVKKAFLASPTSSKNDSSSPTTPEPTFKIDSQAGNKNESKIQAEIQRNYLQLQKKLSLEFQEKLQEWERNKLHAASTSALSASPHSGLVDESKEIAFKKKMEEWQKIKGQPKHNMQLKSEENLPPEFRKKLEEWKKIKKTSIKDDKRKPPELPKWRSFGGPKTDLENQQLSEDFIKKYETWKQIKAGILNPNLENQERVTLKGTKTPSPKIMRKDSSQKDPKKVKDPEKELQWLEKGIEREKHRLERDKQKFMDREQRLSKLRRSVIGHNKKEILVHLPSGFYRFEGISRKFTQKLYEWEKARGIRPEESTFALLNTTCIPHIEPKRDRPQRMLMRSKSADSVMNTEPMCPHLSQRPSSLSLNELENLEEEMLLPDIIRSREENSNEQEQDENEEPEAVIVEVEDVVEETASVINTYAEKYFPVYQHQETDKLCAGATHLGPTIRRSESARAQANYNLIEKIIDVLKTLLVNENDIDDIERSKLINSTQEETQMLKQKQELQKKLSELMIEKLIQLQEANSNVAVNIAREEPKYKMAKLADVLDTIQDLTTELFGLAETIDHFIYKRNKNYLEDTGLVTSRESYPQIGRSLTTMKSKMLELRRNLSYICAASDIAVASFKKRDNRPILRKQSSKEKRNLFKKSRSRDSREDNNNDLVQQSPTLSRQIEQGAVKKRLRYRQKGLQSKTLDESDDDEDEILLQEQRKTKPRRMRSQNSTESNKSQTKSDDQESKENDIITKPSLAEIVVDQAVVEKVLIPTKSTNFMSSYEELSQQSGYPQEDDSPVTVFVKTTRKLFTPVGATATVAPSHQIKSTTDEDRASVTPSTTSSITSTTSSANNNNSSQFDLPSSDNVAHLPPIPASPIPQRKLIKDISPNIRLMMVRYNQKLNEESVGVKSPGSSGSASPVAWRSPVLERRVKAQTEKYQQDLQKMSPLLGGRREVQKSASMDVVVSGNKQVTVHKLHEQGPKGILKSSSTSVIKPSELYHPPIRKNTSPIPEFDDSKEINPKPSSLSSSDVRSIKLQKAKEEFLKGVTTPVVPPKENKVVETNNVDKKLRYPTKNRLSQVSVSSDFSYASSNYGLLIKSASAGMINIDLETYKQFDPELHADGCTSLPRSGSSKKNLLSNLTSKFRKVKMRRNKDKDKDKEKMNTVSTLCRQSLLVDIHNSSQETLSEDQSRLSLPSDSNKSSTDTSPSSSRTSSWIKRSKIFNSKK